MHQNTKLVLALFHALVNVAVTQNGQSSSRVWKYATYPNPMTDVTSCGRNGRQSVICDPDGIISFEEANYVESWIDMAIVQGTDCPCPAKACLSNKKGPTISIALTNQISPQFIAPDGSVQTSGGTPLFAAETFADELRKQWKYATRCDEDVLILFSMDNQTLYTSVGKGVQEKLTPDLVSEINQLHRAYFFKGRNVTVGLHNLITDYRRAFTGELKGSMYNRSYPRVGASTSDSCQNNAIVILTFITAYLVLLVS